MKSGHLKIVKRRKTIKNKKCLRDVAPTGRVCREPKHESYSSVANSRLPDWAYLQPKKPTSELGSLQCKSHLSCIHWIHTHPSDLSFASRWVVWPAGVNRCSSGGAAAGRPHLVLTTLLSSFSPHIPAWQFSSPWLFGWWISSLFLHPFPVLPLSSLFSLSIKVLSSLPCSWYFNIWSRYGLEAKTSVFEKRQGASWSRVNSGHLHNLILSSSFIHPPSVLTQCL